MAVRWVRERLVAHGYLGVRANAAKSSGEVWDYSDELQLAAFQGWNGLLDVRVDGFDVRPGKLDELTLDLLAHPVPDA